MADVKYSEMLSLKKELEEKLLGAFLEKMEKLEEKTWLFLFSSGAKLVVSAQYPFSRFHLTSRRLGGVSTSREIQALSILKDKPLTAVELVGEDRILGLVFGDCRFVAELMFKNPTVALLNPDGNVLVSFCGENLKRYHLPERRKVHDQTLLPCTSAEVEKKYEESMRAATFQALQAALLNTLGKQLKKVDARLMLHRQEWEEAKNWKAVEHVAQLLQVNYPLLKRGMSSIEVEDWESEGVKRVIPLDPALAPEKIVKQHFKEVRKLKKRLSISEELIAGLEKKREGLREAMQAVSDAKDIRQLHPLETKYLSAASGATLKKKEALAHPFREFHTTSGLTLLVGKKDQDNDRLSLSYARGNDLWFHASNCPGSHVVLRLAKGQEADAEALKDAMELALHFSKVKNAPIEEVIYTECKYVAKSRGSPPGQVNVSKHKKRTVHRDPARLQRLLKKEEK